MKRTFADMNQLPRVFDVDTPLDEALIWVGMRDKEEAEDATLGMYLDHDQVETLHKQLGQWLEEKQAPGGRLHVPIMLSAPVSLQLAEWQVYVTGGAGDDKRSWCYTVYCQAKPDSLYVISVTGVHGGQQRKSGKIASKTSVATDLITVLHYLQAPTDAVDACLLTLPAREL